MIKKTISIIALNMLIFSEFAASLQAGLTHLAPPSIKDLIQTAISDKNYVMENGDVSSKFWFQNGLDENPFDDEILVERGFSRIKLYYSFNIEKQIDIFLETLKDRPVKILLLGPGRGYEAFGIMHKYRKFGDRIQIYVADKYNLLYTKPEDLVSRFARDGIEVDYDTCESYINQFRKQKRYLIWDLDKKIIKKQLFNLIIFGIAVVRYVEYKYEAICQTWDICDEGGLIYCNSNRAYFIHKDGRKEKLKDYLCTKFPDIFHPCRNGMQIVKKTGIQMPRLKKIEPPNRSNKFGLDDVDTFYQEYDFPNRQQIINPDETPALNSL